MVCTDSPMNPIVLPNTNSPLSEPISIYSLASSLHTRCNKHKMTNLDKTNSSSQRLLANTLVSKSSHVACYGVQMTIPSKCSTVT